MQEAKQSKKTAGGKGSKQDKKGGIQKLGKVEG